MTTCAAPTDTTAEHPSVALLRAAVDALVAEPMGTSTIAGLTEQITGVTPELHRLDGWVRAAEGELSVRTGGQLPTDDGGPRSVAGWLADVRREGASAAGSRLRTAGLLRQLPLVADAVLDGVLTPAQAHVLTRLVGKIDAESRSCAPATCPTAAVSGRSSPTSCLPAGPPRSSSATRAPTAVPVALPTGPSPSRTASPGTCPDRRTPRPSTPARRPPGPDRRPGPASKRCCATPA